MTTTYEFLLSRLRDIARQADERSEDEDYTDEARERYGDLADMLQDVLEACERKESAEA